MPGTHAAAGGSSMKPPNIAIASSMLPQGICMKFCPLRPQRPSAVQQLAISKPISSKRAHCGSESGMSRHVGSVVVIGPLPIVPHSPSGVQHSEIMTPIDDASGGSAANGLHTSLLHSMPPASTAVPNGAVPRLRPIASSKTGGGVASLAAPACAPIAGSVLGVPAAPPTASAPALPVLPAAAAAGAAVDGAGAPACPAGMVAGTIVLVTGKRRAAIPALPAAPALAAGTGAICTAGVIDSVLSAGSACFLANGLQPAAQSVTKQISN
jgi:hypothetical protein